MYWRKLYKARYIAVSDIIVWATLNCENKWQAWWKGEYSEICLGGGGLKVFQGALSTRWNHKFYWSKGGGGGCASIAIRPGVSLWWWMLQINIHFDLTTTECYEISLFVLFCLFWRSFPIGRALADLGDVD